MGLRKDLRLRRSPSPEEAKEILTNYTERDGYLRYLVGEYISYKGAEIDRSTLLHIGRYIKGVSKTICSGEKRRLEHKTSQLSLF
ncbi:MAG: hypothetical protein ABH804_02040 [archaeon]